MRINKKARIAIVATSSVALLATSFTVLFWPMNVNSALSTYILQFDGETVADSAKKNAYIDSMIKKTNDQLAAYSYQYKKTYNRDFEGLDFQFVNMRSKQSTGEINYYDLLNRTLRGIDPNLGITNLARTPQTVNDGYYNKNTELLSFYWSPDYNSVGTWIKYMITDTYTFSNIWLSTYQILENKRNDPNYPWASSLYSHLVNWKIPGTNERVYRDHIGILAYIASSLNEPYELLIDDYYVTIANLIGSWVKANSDVKVTINADNQKEYSDVGLGIQYVNWIAASNPNIPFAEDGPDSKVPNLVRKGFYNPVNPNTDTVYRDWYIRPNQFGSREKVNIWVEQDPFPSTRTPWNPSFTQAPNTQFAGSNWTALTAWTDIGDNNDPNNPSQPTALVSEGIVNDITHESVIDAFNLTFKPTGTEQSKLTFKIRPIKWVDTSGNVVKDASGNIRYLSPEDFWAGFKGFDRSLKNGLNENNSYFLGLAGLDLQATLNDVNNKVRNLADTDQKEFTVYFKDPVLTLEETLDILSKQYFFALPAFHEKVLNITDDQRYKNITKFIEGTERIDLTTQDFSVYYGCGEGKNSAVWSDILSAAPYYIGNVTEQSITYKLSPSYFESFKDETSITNPTNEKYLNFNLQKADHAGNVMKRIGELNVKYEGSYSENITYEQFKSGELDSSKIQSSNLTIALQQFPQDIKYEVIKKINKSDLVSFNLQVYQKWNELASNVPVGYAPAENIIMNQYGKPMWDPVTRVPLYSIDEYGNYVFPEGQVPLLKTNVSQAYVDLIVKDFFTPGGISQTIRHTIVNAINWVSLKSLYVPGVTKSVQYSFMPYGVYEFEDPVGEYWDYAANKRYMSQAEIDNFNDATITKRLSGNIIWTYDELRKGLIK